jgi:CO/xanthine dehydrogenase FAD-binding subunit
MAVHNPRHGNPLIKQAVLRPGNFSELFSLWHRFPNAVPFAGGTALIRVGSDPVRGASQEHPELPEHILSLERLEDLRSITRTERYLEIGAMVYLNEIIALGKTVPSAFSQTLQGIAGPQVRNLATLGGNICIAGDVTAPLTALDARYELRSASGSRWVPAIRFSTEQKSLAEGELLTRIRVPLDEWESAIYRKFQIQEGEGGVLIILVQNQKDTLTRIQVVFAGEVLLREKESESFLKGKALPLNRRDVVYYRKCWETYLEGLEKPGILLRARIINAVESGILDLAD